MPISWKAPHQQLLTGVVLSSLVVPPHLAFSFFIVTHIFLSVEIKIILN
ncbi:hypothetical protein [Pectobacterium peruviense]|nr:hypothetical protein [Pectobacterium peruviense]